MKISGLVKLTLTDYPGRMAAIVFTQGCNYRCSFCQNSTLLSNNEGLLNENDVLDYLDKRKNVLDGVVISGGEPTIQKDLKDFIYKVKKMGYCVKLDTNGSNPLELMYLLNSNLLDYVAMDIKSIFNDYSKIVCKNVSIDNIKKSIELIKKSKISHEFRTTVIKEFHDINKILEIIKLVDGSRYFIQNFQDSENVIDRSLHGFSDLELKEIKEGIKEFTNVSVRGL